MNAPLLLFVYNRPDHTRQVLEAVRCNPEASSTRLVVFADGAKEDASAEDRTRIAAVRAVVAERDWCGNVEYRFADKNRGLAASVIAGVSEVLSSSERAIVLEDDLVCTPHFLSFMNEALDVYQEDERVISAAAYIYPVKAALPETFFLRGADCWGWATWRTGWRHFEPDGAKLLWELEARDLTRDFDFRGAYPYTKMLRDQIEGRNSSWAVRWYASAFLQDKLTLYPGRSLVRNIGLDGSGTHSVTTASWDAALAEGKPSIGAAPVEEDAAARAAVTDFFLGVRARRPTILQRLRRALPN